MPDETRNYLPKLQALKNIVRDPEKYGLELGDIPDAPYFAVIKSTRKIDVKAAAALAEMSLDEFQYLEPAAQPAGDRRCRRVHDPAADRQGRAVRGEARTSPTSRSCRGRRTGCATARRCRRSRRSSGCRWTRCARSTASAPSRRCRSGHALLVPAQGPAEAAADTLSQCRCSRRFRRAGRSTTASTAATRWRSIASRYAVTPQDLRRWNGISRRRAASPQARSLRITSDLAPDAGTTKRAAGRKASTAAGKPNGEGREARGEVGHRRADRQGQGVGGHLAGIRPRRDSFEQQGSPGKAPESLP